MPTNNPLIGRRSTIVAARLALMRRIVDGSISPEELLSLKPERVGNSVFIKIA